MYIRTKQWDEQCIGRRVARGGVRGACLCAIPNEPLTPKKCTVSMTQGTYELRENALSIPKNPQLRTNPLTNSKTAA